MNCIMGSGSHKFCNSVCDSSSIIGIDCNEDEIVQDCNWMFDSKTKTKKSFTEQVDFLKRNYTTPSHSSGRVAPTRAELDFTLEN